MEKPRISIHFRQGFTIYDCEYLNKALGYDVRASINEMFEMLKMAYMLDKDEDGRYINPTNFDKPTFK